MRFFISLYLILTSISVFSQNGEIETLTNDFWQTVSTDMRQQEKDSLLTQLTKEIISVHADTAIKDFEKIVDAYRLNNTNAAYRYEIDMLYEDLAKLSDGTLIPNFRYKDLNGNFIELHSFKGKPVFIDVWASFCGPCLKQIPDFNKLAGKYPDIHFVAITHDYDMDRWKKAIESKEFSGVHLIDMSGRESDFSLFFKIRMIPRYILVDKNLKVVSSKTYKPSDPDLIKLLDSLL